MTLNTIKTTIGYYLTLLRKYCSFSLDKNTFEDVFNYLRIRDNLATSGQPTKSQFSSIRDQGFKTVINLAPNSAENALKDEQATLMDLGINYIHIPVDFKNPTEADFNMFVDKMQALTDEKVWVHCAANMRVSAFIYENELYYPLAEGGMSQTKIDLNINGFYCLEDDIAQYKKNAISEYKKRF